MNTSVIHRAIELNNLGAAHLNTQNLGDAIVTFREGLAYLKHHHALDDPHATEFLGDCTLSSSQQQRGDAPLFIPVRKLLRDPTYLPGSVRAYSFCHPLLLDENADLPLPPTDLLLCVTHQVSAVILFNLALAHHGMGMQLARTDLHRSAVRLYHAAHSLLQAMEEYVGPPPPPPESVGGTRYYSNHNNHSVPHILKLLSLNNTAQICYDELADYEQMTVALDSMQRAMMMMDEECAGLPRHGEEDGVGRPARASLVSPEDAASLRINATMLQEPATAGAA